MRPDDGGFEENHDINQYIVTSLRPDFVGISKTIRDQPIFIFKANNREYGYIVTKIAGPLGRTLYCRCSNRIR